MDEKSLWLPVCFPAHLFPSKKRVFSIWMELSPSLYSRPLYRTGRKRFSLLPLKVYLHLYYPRAAAKRRDITKTLLFKYIVNFNTKNWKFSDKKSDIFHISVQNIDCGYSLEPPRRGGSNEYPQSMFLSRNKKNNVYPCKPQFYYIKVEFKRVKII